MGFASIYLQNRAIFPEFISEAPDPETGIVIVIPALNEPEICKTLDSVLVCSKPPCKVEVIIVVNAPAYAQAEILDNNKMTIENIESWKKSNVDCFFRLFIINIVNPPIKDWGVGLARKTGMDEATRRFNFLESPEGVILNLDADCTVDQNYLVEVYNKLFVIKERAACSIYFEHPLEGSDLPPEYYNYILLYELHLRFYYQALIYSQFPNTFHTVGSAIAVKAIAYVKEGGMNRRRAGEDFYFIQKLIPGGGYFTLNTTTVYPSPRASTRVPFGTGASIGKMSETNSNYFFTYNTEAFKELKLFFNICSNISDAETGEMTALYNTFPSSLKAFLSKEEWGEKLSEIRANTSGPEAFRKRFFSWFNMFKIVKYLNFVHQQHFEKQLVEISASELMTELGITFKSKKIADLLLIYRQLEK